MYLHLGKGVVVENDSVLAVFDLDNSSSSHITRQFLRRAEDNGEVISVGDDLPRSFVLCSSDKAQRVYLSQLSSATLLKRGENISLE